MNALNLRRLVLLVVFYSTAITNAQDPFRGLLTTTLGDVAAIKQRAEAGDPQAQASLGNSLAANFHTAEALRWYRKAAVQGHVDGAHQVGRLLLYGGAGIPVDQTVKLDPTEGIRWTFTAATNHHAEACHNMAKALQRGLGVSTNWVEAYAWLQLFADSPGGSIVGRVELNQMTLKMDSREVERARALAAQFKQGRWQQPVVRAIQTETRG